MFEFIIGTLIYLFLGWLQWEDNRQEHVYIRYHEKVLFLKKWKYLLIVFWLPHLLWDPKQDFKDKGWDLLLAQEARERKERFERLLTSRQRQDYRYRQYRTQDGVLMREMYRD